VTLLALDTATLYYRNYFALPESMTAPDGFPNNAVRGTLSMLTALVNRWKTTNIAACWDGNWRPKWRVALLPEYKAHRLADDADEEREPDTLGPQIGALGDIFDALGIFRPSFDDYEADDVIASIVRDCQQAIVVTSDRDLVQVIRGSTIRLHLMVNGGMDAWPVLDAEAAEARYGVPPHQYVDMAVLRGDPSDGLPGVRGIGAKTAVGLTRAFGSLEQVIDTAADPKPPMTPRQGRLIAEAETTLQHAKQVATAVADLRITPKPWRPTGVRVRVLNQLSSEWGVESLVERLRGALQAQDDTAA
jgi:5'-3' exonuclease